MRKQFLTIMAAAAIGTAAVVSGGVPSAYAQSQSVSAGFVDLQEAGAYGEAIRNLAGLGVFSGYEDGSVKPNRPMNQAELAKVLTVAFGLQAKPDGSAQTGDIPANEWYSDYASIYVQNGLKAGAGESGKFVPAAVVTQEDVVGNVAKLIGKKPLIVSKWMDSYAANKPLTRAEAAQLIWKALPHIPSANAEVASVKALNPVTLEVTFTAPLTAADVNLDQAKKNFAFDNGMSLLNVPQLKSGARATYIVPVSVHKPGTVYTMEYKGKPSGSFEAATNKIQMGTARQTLNDTFEIESYFSDGTIDYGFVIEAYYGNRWGMEKTLDETNSADGTSYQIISSMRDKEVTITPEGGQPIVAKYVPFTQATDLRQAPKFRLPAGQTLQPGVVYTVSSEWSTIREASFTARDVAPLAIQAANFVNETSIEVVLAEDPKDEIFAGRSVMLTAEDGTSLTANYRYSSRKGAAGIFDLANGAKLAPRTTYKLASAGTWAAADGISVKTK